MHIPGIREYTYIMFNKMDSIEGEERIAFFVYSLIDGR